MKQISVRYEVYVNEAPEAMEPEKVFRIMEPFFDRVIPALTMQIATDILAWLQFCIWLEKCYYLFSQKSKKNNGNLAGSIPRTQNQG
ncbi:MAG: hypothetical protein WBA22_04540 [Candidatus Methanofastidiosia archaeon]